MRQGERIQRVWAILFGLAALAFTGVAAAQDDFRGPDEAPGQWLLAITDVETTGLTPGYHEMIDAGFVYTDLEGHELGHLFVRIMPEHPERLDAGAAAVNGFSVERWDSFGALSPADAVARIVAFHDSVSAGRDVMLVALNSQFDTAFLDHLFRGQDRAWRDLYYYYVLDIPSMAWSLGLHGLSGRALSAELGVEDEPHDPLLHTGITGADVNARLYRALVQRAKQKGMEGWLEYTH